MSLTSLPPQFIVFEGGDGAGKSTQLKLLSEKLTELGIDHITTREPGGTPMAEEIRDVMLKKRDEPVAGNTELLLIFAARQQHLDNRILPALAEGRWVLCDRFIETTYAYQCVGRGVNEGFFFDMMVNVVGDHSPHLTIYLDVDDEVSVQRRAARKDGSDRIDDETQEFFTKINDTLRGFALNLPHHATVDGNQPEEAVANDVFAFVEDLANKTDSDLDSMADTQTASP